MKKLLLLIAVYILLLPAQVYADLEFLRLDINKQTKAHAAFYSTQCTCGCDMSVGQCLIDDPSCTVSPSIAKNIIAKFANSATDIQPPKRSSRQPVSDNGIWHNRISGKLLLYMKTTSFNRVKECTWLYRDGTFSDNTQGGIISGGSVSITGASQGGNTGRWSTNNEVVTFQYDNGKQQRYSMSYGQDGLLYLDNYRHFLLEHNDDVCN